MDATNKRRQRAKDACTVSVPKDFMLGRDLSNAFTNQYLVLRKSVLLLKP
jgi:hypothetical protein